MSAISLIHAPGDALFGDQIADALSRDGHRVKRHIGDPLSGDLGLDDSLAIVVWSRAAAKLARIHEQAREALARGALIPVAIGAAEAPRGFENLPPVDLSGWSGELEDPRWRFVLGEINVAAHRNILEDGSVWAGAAEAEQLQDTDIPASAIISDADWPPENDNFAPDYSAPDHDVEEDEIHAAPPDHAASSRPAGIRPFHVAIGASLGLAILTAAATVLAPIFLRPPDRIVRVAPPTQNQPEAGVSDAPAKLALAEPAPAVAAGAAATAGDADAADANSELPIAADAPTTLAFVTPVAIDAEGNAVGIEIAAPESESSPPSIENLPGENLLAVDAPVETGADPALIVADNDALENLVAAVTSGTAPEGGLSDDTDPLTDEVADRMALGDYFKDCDLCPDMAELPAGGFSFGSPPGEPARHVSEGPVTYTTISKSLALGAREVTFTQWQACVDEGGCKGYTPYDHGWGRGDRPVQGVSYEDAEAYTLWLSAKTGQHYRLPTEAEWEYAARAGSAAPFSFGYAVSADQANFNGEHAYGAPVGVNRKRTIPTASFDPNAFGLFDMHGNVWEWTADCWTASHDPSRDADCMMRVLKGGAWNSGGWRLRSAHRIGKKATARENDNGFRVVRDMN